jgi:hypothetical protein
MLVHNMVHISVSLINFYLLPPYEYGLGIKVTKIVFVQLIFLTEKLC